MLANLREFANAALEEGALSDEQWRTIDEFLRTAETATGVAQRIAREVP